jgi:hypothetical protein
LRGSIKEAFSGAFTYVVQMCESLGSCFLQACPQAVTLQRRLFSQNLHISLHLYAAIAHVFINLLPSFLLFNAEHILLKRVAVSCPVCSGEKKTRKWRNPMYKGYIYLCSCCSHLEHRASVKRFVSLQFLNLRQPVGLFGRGISQTKGSYLTQAQNKRRQTSMSWVGFEPKIPVCERAKIFYALLDKHRHKFNVLHS